MDAVPDFLSQIEKVSSKKEEFLAFKIDLTNKIQYLLDRNPNEFFQFCYRFDLSEEKVKSAIFGIGTQSSASQLAELVLQRALEKIETRKKYR